MSYLEEILAESFNPLYIEAEGESKEAILIITFNPLYIEARASFFSISLQTPSFQSSLH